MLLQVNPSNIVSYLLPDSEFRAKRHNQLNFSQKVFQQMYLYFKKHITVSTCKFNKAYIMFIAEIKTTLKLSLDLLCSMTSNHRVY